jgi:hypothetical protein
VHVSQFSLGQLKIHELLPTLRIEAMLRGVCFKHVCMYTNTYIYTSKGTNITDLVVVHEVVGLPVVLDMWVMHRDVCRPV